MHFHNYHILRYILKIHICIIYTYVMYILINVVYMRPKLDLPLLNKASQLLKKSKGLNNKRKVYISWHHNI